MSDIPVYSPRNYTTFRRGTTQTGLLLARLLVLPTIFLLLFTGPALAQRTLTYTDPSATYRRGLELFEQGQYAAARLAFRQFVERQPANATSSGVATPGVTSADLVSAEYYVALASLYLEEPGAEVLADRFVRQHPENPRATQLYADLGRYYYGQGNYAQAITFFEKALAQQPGQPAEVRYQLALSYYNTNDYARARPLLDVLKQDASFADQPGATYYAGVMAFRQGDWAGAVRDFRRIEQNGTYRNEVPGFIGQALYRQGRYDELLTYAEPLLRSGALSEGARQPLALVTAEALYKQAQYARAVPYYQQYFRQKSATPAPAPVRFRYGQSLYKTGDYAGAITELTPVAGGRDTTAQYAAYTLGVSYLQTRRPAEALAPFSQAARLPFNAALAEEARFTYAKLLLEQRRGAEAIRALTDFQAQYPNSTFSDEATELIGESYLVSNNYPAAIAYIEGLRRRTPALNATYQRLTYNQGVADYTAGRYEAARRSFAKSLQQPADAELRANALFWTAESHAIEKQYADAIARYEQVRTGPNARRAIYGLGYAYFNQKNYSRALGYFREYLKGAADQPTADDAVLRVADALLAGKQYADALRYYEQAVANGRADADYAAYQRGLVLGYLGRDADAQAQFSSVQRQFPQSRFADEAIFQAANVDFEKAAYAQAVQGFSRLINGRTQSALLPQALLKRAIAYSNLQQYDPAVADYRRILTDFPQSSAASGALLGLQNTLNDAGRPEEFGDVLARYKQRNPDVSGAESLEFENAKNIYFAEKYDAAVRALSAFLRENPNSANALEARYYLADSYAKAGDAPSALRTYDELLRSNSPYTARAASRAADVARKQGDATRALPYYRVAVRRASTKNEEVGAQVALAETYLLANQPDSAAITARIVLPGAGAVPGAAGRAQLVLGKAALAKGDAATAQTELQRTADTYKDAAGAEALYLFGQSLYQQKKYRESIAQLLKFNESFDEFAVWKGRAFLLVADNNIALNEVVQARAVLQSIIENADDPQTVADAKARLQTLDTK